jgi:16S rRNA processing protein RimM
MSTPDTDDLQPLGKIIDTHGLRGELKVRTHPEDREALLAARRVFLQLPGASQPRPLTPVKARSNKGYVVIQFEGVDHISQVANLVGQEVLVVSADIRRTAGKLFWFELSGLRVVDQQRGDIGVLEDMFVTAAHGIYVIQGRFGEVLIPAIEPFVLDLDRETGVLQVDVPDGLFPDSP